MITVVGNLKGGSGKSTVTFNLAVWLADRGQNVLTYDLDPQCTLSDVLQVRQEENYTPAIRVHNRYNHRPQEPNDSPTEVLIDVGASNMAAMKKAIALADRVVVPVAPSQADLWSTQRFLYMVGGISKDKPPQVVMFVNRADTHSAIRESDQTEAALRALPAVHVLSARLCQRTAYRRSFSEGLAVFELEPHGKAAQEFEVFAHQLYDIS
ncbi:ParA family protein [Thioflexithrix psekupsensis]|uniref:Chromosome partitioning protein n=1 Tax=Thioflexithrix psekupsensis TaxID=1570016 RepID=A0A251XBV1_9GAMM|nr:ParA family protein [Thioflexithrix psekupsensis]OUD16058.1 chromosome partitioning protein [Thioflexithrix psekupsensis]